MQLLVMICAPLVTVALLPFLQRLEDGLDETGEPSESV
jgi:hypothetical protein